MRLYQATCVGNSLFKEAKVIHMKVQANRLAPAYTESSELNLFHLCVHEEQGSTKGNPIIVVLYINTDQHWVTK